MFELLDECSELCIPNSNIALRISANNEALEEPQLPNEAGANLLLSFLGELLEMEDTISCQHVPFSYRRIGIPNK